MKIKIIIIIFSISIINISDTNLYCMESGSSLSFLTPDSAVNNPNPFKTTELELDEILERRGNEIDNLLEDIETNHFNLNKILNILSSNEKMIPILLKDNFWMFIWEGTTQRTSFKNKITVNLKTLFNFNEEQFSILVDDITIIIQLLNIRISNFQETEKTEIEEDIIGYITAIITMANNIRQTILHIAANFGCTEFIKLVINFVIENRYEDKIDYIINILKQKDCNDETILTILNKKNYIELIEYIFSLIEKLDPENSDIKIRGLKKISRIKID